ncbi:hypothetical protein [Haliscomenobacter sp.]|uniref:hypothetical protein n=1 Tax=Haliscomenobacter sp. TaxID=2717303 RepID=UPI003BAD7D5D
MKTLFNTTKERGIVLFLALFLSVTLGDKTSPHPSVYVFNGEKYVVQGELYSGMIGENLANYEYFPLPALQAQAGNFQLRISNESNGQQFTDMAQLLVVQHPQNKEVIMDQRGKAHLIGKAQKPNSVTSSNGSDLSLATGAKDDQVFAFDNEEFSRNAVILKFKKPERTERGKLILRAQSSEWMAQVLDSYYRKFGKDFPNWLQEQNALSSPERLQGMRDNDLPLSVYLKRDGEWELLEYFVATTPLQARDLVIPLNLMTIKDTELEMKVETGFKFWELDYAAMDFTPNGQVTTTFIPATSALNQDKTNALALLADADLKYVVLKKTGDYLELLYPESAVTNGGGANTFFLYTKGYSEMNARFEGAPAVNDLKTLKEPGALADYSKMEYLKRKAEGKVSSM